MADRESRNAESQFGIMELLQKLFKERGTGVSDKEMGIMTGKPAKKLGNGYESFIDKNTGEFKRTDTTYQAGEMQYIDPLANTPPYSNATTDALNTMRGFQQGGNAMLYGGGDLRAWNKDFPNEQTFTPLPAPEKFWNDGTTSNDPNMLQPLGAVSNVDTMFAQALNSLSDIEQAEIVNTTRGYTDEQVENFKIQYLQGRVSPYELEQQRNLGF